MNSNQIKNKNDSQKKNITVIQDFLKKIRELRLRNVNGS